MNSKVHALSIIYQNASKTFQVTKRTTAPDFTDLLQEAFDISERIIGFQDPEGKFYELSDLFDAERRPDRLFLITDYNLSKFTDHLSLMENPHNVSDLEHETFPIRFITSFDEYKTLLRKGDDSGKKLNVFLLFNNLAEARTYMENSISTVFDVDQKDLNISFTVVDENLSSEAYSIFTELPCLAVFVQRKKILELSLDCPSGFIQRLINRVLSHYEEVVMSDRSREITPMKEAQRVLKQPVENEKKRSAPQPKSAGVKAEDIGEKGNRLIVEVLEKVHSIKLISDEDLTTLIKMVESKQESLRDLMKDHFLEETGMSELGAKLKKLLNQGQVQVEPSARNVEKDESKDIFKIMNLVRKIAEENGPGAFSLINQLILENDPLIESALDIFMEDDDEMELRDTLKRIVEKKKDRLASETKNTGQAVGEKKTKAPGSKKKIGADEKKPEAAGKPHAQAVIEKNAGLPGEKDPSLREEKAKKDVPPMKNEKKKEDPVKDDRKALANKREEKTKKAAAVPKQEEGSQKKLQKSASSVMDSQSLEESLIRYSDEFEDEEVGMVQYLLEAEDSAILDFPRMHRKNIITLEKVIEGLKEYARKKFAEKLSHKFTEKELEQINRSKHLGNYKSIFKEFRNGHNLAKLIQSIETEMSQSSIMNSSLNPVPLVPHNSLVSSPNLENKIQEKANAKKIESKINEAVKKDPALEFRKQHSDRSFKIFLKSKNDASEDSHYTMKTIPLVATHDTFERPSEVSEALSDFYIKQKELDMSEMLATFERLKKVGLDKNYLVKEDMKKLDILFENNDFFLHALLFQYKSIKNLGKIKNELKDLLNIETEDLELVSSPLTKSKIRKYHNFKHLIKTLLDTGRIGMKKYKLYNYLFVKEDLSILSAFEVYLMNKNWEEFIENLFIIERLSTKRTHLKANEIEEFDLYIEEQLKILFILRQKLSSTSLDTLEKEVRKGDNKLLGLYERLKKQSVSLKEFINSIQDFSKRKYSEEMKELKSQKESHQHLLNKEKQIELLNTLKEQKYLNSVHNISLLHEMVNEKNEAINRVFEDFQKHKNKKDIAESLVKVYEESTRKNFKEIVRAHALRKNWPKDQVKRVAESIDAGHEALLGAYEFYSTDINEDSIEELLDTVGRFIKM